MTEERATPAPLVPRTPAATLAAGGLGASVLAALGWLAQEFIDIEKRIERIEERSTASAAHLEDDIDELRANQSLVRERLIIVEHTLLDEVKDDRN